MTMPKKKVQPTGSLRGTKRIAPFASEEAPTLKVFSAMPVATTSNYLQSRLA